MSKHFDEYFNWSPMQYHNLLFTWSPYSNKTSEKRKPPESRERLQCLNLNWLYRTKPSPDLQVGSHCGAADHHHACAEHTAAVLVSVKLFSVFCNLIISNRSISCQKVGSLLYFTLVFVFAVDESAGLYKYKEAKFEVYLPQY